MRQQTTKRQYFTLFEILLVITLIALIGGTCVFSLPKALKQEREEKSMASLIAKVEIAKEVMVDYDADVTLILSQAAEGVTCHLYPSKPMRESIKKALNKESFFPGIERVVWRGVTYRELKLPFVASDGKIPEGVLELHCKEKVCRYYLPGYLGEIKKNYDTEIQKPQAPYPQEVLSLA